MNPINHPSYNPFAAGSLAQDVSDAIDESKAKGHVVDMPRSAAAAAMLEEECEDFSTDTSTSANRSTYRGRDCDGNRWSVRLV